MTTIERASGTRTVHFHDPAAPPASRVVPSVFVAARWTGGRLLLVRRCDSGTWELPGGRVDVGETAVQAAVRERGLRRVRVPDGRAEAAQLVAGRLVGRPVVGVVGAGGGGDRAGEIILTYSRSRR